LPGAAAGRGGPRPAPSSKSWRQSVTDVLIQGVTHVLILNSFSSDMSCAPPFIVIPPVLSVVEGSGACAETSARRGTRVPSLIGRNLSSSFVAASSPRHPVHSPLVTRPFSLCHPEQSEGSAFRFLARPGATRPASFSFRVIPPRLKELTLASFKVFTRLMINRDCR